jgi:hypothetical protein
MEACGFSRMAHLAHSPDLAPCNFLLFGCPKENVAGQSLDTDEELFSSVPAVLAAISG